MALSPAESEGRTVRVEFGDLVLLSFLVAVTINAIEVGSELMGVGVFLWNSVGGVGIGGRGGGSSIIG